VWKLVNVLLKSQKQPLQFIVFLNHVPAFLIFSTGLFCNVLLIIDKVFYFISAWQRHCLTCFLVIFWCFKSNMPVVKFCKVV